MVRTFTLILDFSFFQFLGFSHFWATFPDFVPGQENNTPGLILIKYQYPVHTALTKHCSVKWKMLQRIAILSKVNENTEQNTGGQLHPIHSLK